MKVLLSTPTRFAAQIALVRNVTTRQVLFLLRTACGGDFRALCPGVPVGGERVIDCLQAKAASLALNCQAALGALGR